MSVANIFPNKDQFDTMNVLLASIAGQSGGIAMKRFKDIQMLNRLGLASKVMVPGDQIAVEKESSINATVSGNISAASVNADTFIAKMGTVHDGVYEFSYNGAAWHLDGEAVELSEYGISVTGTAQDGDLIEVHETATTLVFDIVDFDKHHPADPNLKHSISLLCHEAVAGFAYNPTQAMACIRSGGPLPAGTYCFTVDATYDPSYNGHDSGAFAIFQLTQPVPTGGQIMLGWGYNAQLSAAKISTYQQFGTTPIESNIAIDIEEVVSTSVKNLGTIANGLISTTTIDGVTVAINNAARARYGSNDIAHSCMMQWLSSDAASGWHHQVSEFDRPQTTPTAGFLYGIDPEFKAVLGRVKLRTAKNTVTDGGGYTDGEYLGWLASMTELGWGANNSVYETSPDADSNVSNEPFALYDGATNSDRIKYNNGTARVWWLRSPNPSSANGERSVITDGSLNHSGADYGSWAVPGLDII
jgi:hypothetical protein